MSSITVSASVYSLCDGSNGACGDCNNNAMEAAWANLANHGNYFTSSCVCNGFNGENLPQFSCGQVVTVKDICNSVSGTITISDSDNPGGCLCDHDCNGYYSVLRTMDLTEAAMYYFTGTTYDLIGVTVTY